MKARRLLVITPSGKHLGGSERMLDQFLASARAAGIVVHVIFLDDGDQFKEVASAGYSCECIRVGRLRYIHRWVAFAITLIRILRLHRPDMVIGWQSKVAAYASIPCWLTRMPFFCFHRGYPSKNGIDRASYLLHCSGYITNSLFTAQRLGQFVHRPVAVVHSTVDIDLFSRALAIPPAEAKQKFNFDPNKPLVGIVGRLQYWKGMHVFVQAMSIVSQTIDCQAVIVGGTHDMEPDYPAFLQERIYLLEMTGRVRMVGAQDAPSEWMQAMDVFVHASDREPFGLVVVEAMSLGKPVIATMPGGPAEVITHEQDGLLVEYGDHEALAKAIIRYLTDVSFAKACGDAARKSVTRFDGRDYAQTLVDRIDALKVRPRRKTQRQS